MTWRNSAVLIAFAGAVLLLTAGARLEELWRLPLGLGLSSITSEPLTASTRDAYFGADSRGTIFAVSTDGTLLWSNPGSPTISALLTAPGVDDVLLVGYVTNASLEGATIQALDTRTGSQLWNRTFVLGGYSPLFALDGDRGALIFALYNASDDTYAMVSYGLHHGEVRWTQHVEGTIYRMFISKSVIVLDGYFGGGVQATATFSPTTGSPLCRLNTSAELFWNSLADNMIFWQVEFGSYGLFDATTCAMLANLTALGETMSLEPFPASGHMLVFGTDSQNWFLALYAQDGAQRWSVTLPTPVSYIAGVPVAGVDGDMLYVSWGVVLAAFDLRTGAMRWRSAQPLPVAPNSIPLIPMGHGRALVPNLQGYVLLDTNTQRVLDVNLHQPLTAPLWHHLSGGSTAVVVGELGSGDLVALHNRWEPLRTVWEVPLAIGGLPTPTLGNAVMAAQDAVNYYVADGVGVIFALEAASGRVLWSVLGGSNLSALNTLPSYPDRVFATMTSNVGAEVRALSAADGTVLWNVAVSLPPSSFVAGSLLTDPAVLLLTVDIALPVLVAYSPMTGAQMWSMGLDGWQGSFPIVASNEIGFIQTLVEDQPTLLQVFNLTTGAAICSTNVVGSIQGVSRVNAVVTDDFNIDVISGTSCAMVRNLTAEYGPYFIFGASSIGIAVVNRSLSGAVALSLVGAWTTPIPLATVPPSEAVTLVANPAAPGQLLFRVALYFGAVDAANGTLLWGGVLPDQQSSVSALPVFPLGPSTVFVPTILGYSVYDPTSQTVLHNEVDFPITATAFYTAGQRTGEGMVVFVDVQSGAVKAMAENF